MPKISRQRVKAIIQSFNMKEWIFRGKKVYISIANVRSEDIGFHAGLSLYHIRHSDINLFKPVTIDNSSYVNHWGILLSSEPIEPVEDSSDKSYCLSPIETAQLIDLVS